MVYYNGFEGKPLEWLSSLASTDNDATKKMTFLFRKSSCDVTVMTSQPKANSFKNIWTITYRTRQIYCFHMLLFKDIDRGLFCPLPVGNVK